MRFVSNTAWELSWFKPVWMNSQCEPSKQEWRVLVWPHYSVWTIETGVASSRLNSLFSVNHRNRSGEFSCELIIQCEPSKQEWRVLVWTHYSVRTCQMVIRTCSYGLKQSFGFGGRNWCCNLFTAKFCYNDRLFSRFYRRKVSGELTENSVGNKGFIEIPLSKALTKNFFRVILVPYTL